MQWTPACSSVSSKPLAPPPAGDGACQQPQQRNPGLRHGRNRAAACEEISLPAEIAVCRLVAVVVDAQTVAGDPVDLSDAAAEQQAMHIERATGLGIAVGQR